MLTAGELSYFFRGGKYFVRFLNPEDPFLNAQAEQLINCFSCAALSHSRITELEQEVSCIRQAYDAKTVDALYKLLMDRTVTEPASGADHPQIRRKVFQKVFELFAEGEMDWEKIRAGASVPEDLYGDLPGFEKIISFKSITPGELLNRCNLALAQGMLYFASGVELVLEEKDPAQLRKMMKYLKFFRLLAEVEQGKDNKTLKLKISGPFSIFGASRKYALNLACFFPAVVNLSKWKLKANLEIRGRSGIFELSEKKKLVSHYRNFSAYVPEEIKLYHRLFSERAMDWEIIGETPFFSAGGQRLIFPDLSFRHRETGTLFHLELFHRWHSGQLADRLALLKEKPELPLLLGVDRSILPADGLEEEIKTGKVFLFRDFPGVERTLTLLENQLCRTE